MITDYIKYHNDNAYIVKREIAKHNFTNKQILKCIRLLNSGEIFPLFIKQRPPKDALPPRFST